MNSLSLQGLSLSSPVCITITSPLSLEYKAQAYLCDADPWLYYGFCLVLLDHLVKILTCTPHQNWDGGCFPSVRKIKIVQEVRPIRA